MRTLPALLLILPSIVAWSSSSDSSRRAFFQSSAAALFVGAAPANAVGSPIRYGDESIMVQKEHGTSANPVQSDLLYGVDNQLADRICNYNRHFAEIGGYFQKTTFEDAVLNAQGPITFYDSVTGKPLFVAPKNRSAEEFVKESRKHGWPSFRDDETVSLDGTHLGHNLPDSKGNRYCINLVSIAGKPTGSV